MSVLQFVADEIGLKTLVNGGRDVFLIIFMRMVRLLSFGATSLILVIFLKELGIDEATIGFFMTLAFFGDLIKSFGFSLIADGLGRKFTLIVSSTLMALTCFAIAFFDNFVVLTLVAALGILTPGGGEVGPFRSIEQSAIASLVPHDQRSDIYAWYTFLGTFSAAFGSFVCGSFVDFLQDKWHYTALEAYKGSFVGFGVLSVICLISCFFLTPNLEVTHKPTPSAEQAAGEAAASAAATNNTPADAAETQELLPKQKPKWRLLPELSKDIVSIVLKLSFLFGLDAFASSLVQGSWLTYYIKNKFDVSSTTLGTIFFVTFFIAGAASLLSTSFTKRLGPVVTMVVTHLPASTMLILLPLPKSLTITLAIMLIRASTQSMDVAPKHVFLATLVPAEYRTAVFGWTNIVKTTAQMFGPYIAGYLTGKDIQWITFIMAGSLKVLYDVGILATFLSYNRHKAH